MNDGYPTKSPRTRGSALAQLTGAATLAIGALLYGNGSSQLQTLAPGAAGTVLVSQGAAAPAWVNIYGQANVWSSVQTIDLGTGALPSASGTPIIRLWAADSTAPQIEGGSYGSIGLQLRGRAFGGTRASVAATTAAQTFYSVNVFGHDGVGYTVSAAARLLCSAGSAWSATNQDAYWFLTHTPAGTVGQQTIMTWRDNCVGVGSVAPLARLHVAQSGTTALTLAFLHNTQAVGTSGQGVQLSFGCDSGSTPGTPNAYIRALSEAGGSATALTFATFSGAAILERMRINSAGAVVIATDPGGSEVHRVGGGGRYSANLTVSTTTLSNAFTQLGGALGTGSANARNHFVQFNAGTSGATTGWIAAAFGDASAPRVVIGQNDGKCVLGGHDGNISAWDHFYLSGTNTKNIGFFVSHATSVNWQSLQGGQFIGNCAVAPTGNPSGGGFFWVESGALKYRGSTGTVTTLAPA